MRGKKRSEKGIVRKKGMTKGGTVGEKKKGRETIRKGRRLIEREGKNR